MSSHHIIREGQEPALIIGNGEACSFELIQQLLEWSPFVVVLHEALVRVQGWGIKMDALVGNFTDEQAALSLVADQMPVEIVQCCEGNSGLQQAIQFIIQRQIPAVNIAGFTLNGEVKEIILASSGQINIVVFEKNSRIYPIHPHFEKWFVKGTGFDLIPIPEAGEVRTEGLVTDINEGVLSSEKFCCVAGDGIVAIEYRSGVLLLREQVL